MFVRLLNKLRGTRGLCSQQFFWEQCPNNWLTFHWDDLAAGAGMSSFLRISYSSRKLWSSASCWSCNPLTYMQSDDMISWHMCLFDFMFYRSFPGQNPDLVTGRRERATPSRTHPITPLPRSCYPSPPHFFPSLRARVWKH